MMEKSSKNLVLLFISFFFLSCSTMRYHIKRNTTETQKQVNRLYKKNGNAFYLCSTFATFSVVWTYSGENIEIFRMQKGKVKRKQIFRAKYIIQNTMFSPEDIEDELYRKCAMVLDGDVFGYIIDINHKTYNANYDIDINCLKQGQFKSDFWGLITHDINNFGMWEFD